MTDSTPNERITALIEEKRYIRETNRVNRARMRDIKGELLLAYTLLYEDRYGFRRGDRIKFIDPAFPKDVHLGIITSVTTGKFKPFYMVRIITEDGVETGKVMAVADPLTMQHA